MQLFANPMHQQSRSAPLKPLALFVTLCLLALAAFAQDRGVRVARISLIEGEVSQQPAGETKKEWFDASLNMPLDAGDQLYSGASGRAEIQLTGRNLIRISRDTNLRFTQFSSGAVHVALPIGTATFNVESLDRRQFNFIDARDGAPNDPVYFEVATPTIAVTFVKEGDYRINVREDGATEVIVRRGQAEIYNQALGTVVVRSGSRALVTSGAQYELARVLEKDNWDRWNDSRDNDLFARVDSYRSNRYVPVGVPGVYDLDRYGEWLDTPDYGWVWSPRDAGAGWAPYRAGYWRWYPAYGWTWVSTEPWGWAPYHYGRWAYYRSRWCWTPLVNTGLAFDWGWRPHLVTFYGWGGSYNPGYRNGYRDGYYDGYRDARWYGWTPLGPGEHYHGYGGRFGNQTVINNTTIINNTTVIRDVTSLRNYNAPGGVNTLDAHRFDNGRVIVRAQEVNATAPPRGAINRGGSSNDAAPAVIGTEQFKPTQSAPARALPTARVEVARRLEAPVVVRRAPGTTVPGAPVVNPATSAPARAAGVPTSEGQPARSGQAIPARPARGTPEAAEAPARTPNSERAERPARAIEYKPAERVPAPAWRQPSEGRRAPEATNEREASAPTHNNERRVEAPANPAPASPAKVGPPVRVERPAREEAPRRVDPPVRPSVERSQPAPTTPPREMRRPDPPPAREAAPARASERPTERPAPPQRESAPTRESAPARASERSSERPTEHSSERPAPTRKPDA